jgi:tetratricopeptide (TPR) repeat protein
MKNRLLILLIIVAFILAAGSYVFIDQSPASTPDNVSASEYFSGYESKSGSSSPSVAPSSKNVSSSYYQQTQQLESYLSEHPSDTTHILRLARLYQDGHQNEKAILWYKKLIELQPQNRQAYLDLINTYGSAQLWAYALETTDKLLAISPDDEEAIYNQAAILANQGKFSQAKTIWTNLLAESESTHIKDMTNKALDMLPPH